MQSKELCVVVCVWPPLPPSSLCSTILTIFLPHTYRPAQKAFVDVATAIAQFETVTVCANTLQVEAALAALPDEIGVIALPQDDAWFRDTGPTVRD